MGSVASKKIDMVVTSELNELSKASTDTVVAKTDLSPDSAAVKEQIRTKTAAPKPSPKLKAPDKPSPKSTTTQKPPPATAPPKKTVTSQDLTQAQQKGTMTQKHATGSATRKEADSGVTLKPEPAVLADRRDGVGPVVRMNRVAPVVIKSCREEYQKHEETKRDHVVYGRLGEDSPEHALISVSHV